MFTACQHEYTEVHGSTKGTYREVSCPMDGYIKRIIYTYSNINETSFIKSISLICSSSKGETNEGTFGTGGEHSTILNCGDAQIMKYFYGYAGKHVNVINRKCEDKPVYNSVKEGTEHNVKQDKVEEKYDANPAIFDDDCFATNGRRPVRFIVWFDEFVNAIQVQYSNIPVEQDCKVTHVQIDQKDIIFRQFGFEVVGFTFGSTCAPLQQQIHLDVYHGYTESEDVEKGKAQETMEGESLSAEAVFGLDLQFKASFSATKSLFENAGMIDSKSGQTSLVNEYGFSTGTTIYYEGPGIAIVFGFKAKYDVHGKSDAPVKYNYTCKGGSKEPLLGNGTVLPNIFGNVAFLDYQFTFNTTEECMASSYSQECVSSIKINNFIPHLDQLENEFFKCFDPDAKKIFFDN